METQQCMTFSPQSETHLETQPALVQAVLNYDHVTLKDTPTTCNEINGFVDIKEENLTILAPLPHVLFMKSIQDINTAQPKPLEASTIIYVTTAIATLGGIIGYLIEWPISIMAVSACTGGAISYFLKKISSQKVYAESLYNIVETNKELFEKNIDNFPIANVHFGARGSIKTIDENLDGNLNSVYNIIINAPFTAAIFHIKSI